MINIPIKLCRIKRNLEIVVSMRIKGLQIDLSVICVCVRTRARICMRTCGRIASRKKGQPQKKKPSMLKGLQDDVANPD